MSQPKVLRLPGGARGGVNPQALEDVELTPPKRRRRPAEAPLLEPARYRVLIEIGTADSPRAAEDLIRPLIGMRIMLRSDLNARNIEEVGGAHYSGKPRELSALAFTVERA